MPGESTESIARALAVYLEHLRRFRGLAYVTETAPAATMSTVGSQPAGEPAHSTAEVRVDRTTALREQARNWSAATKLEYLQRHNLGDCQRCPLSRTRKNIVFGVGNAEADLMFVGEAPGADEDQEGEPFVGRAGQLLNEWVAALGLARSDVYIANVLKCRPPRNRDPKPEEVDRCSPFLRAQIRAIAPRVIVALGRHAAMLLCGREDLPLRAMRTAQLAYVDTKAGVRIPLVPTYHPAYVLRQEQGDRTDGAQSRSNPAELVRADLERALALARDDR